MRLHAAFFRGLWSALRAPRAILRLWLAMVLVALPASLLVGRAVHDSIAGRTVSDDLRRGFDLVWHSEFRAESGEGAAGAAATLEPSRLGVGAFLDNLELQLGGGLFTLEPGLVATGALYALVWLLLLGGVLESLMRTEGSRRRGFLASGGAHFGRFLRSALVSGVLYWLIYRFAGWLFPAIERWTRDVTVERRVLAAYLAGAAAVALLLVTVRLISDLAKIVLFVEERRSAVLATLRAARFLLSRPLRLYGLWIAVALVGVALLALYSIAAPGPGTATWTAVAGAFLVGQLLLVLRLGLRLTLLGGELALYRDARRSA